VSTPIVQTDALSGTLAVALRGAQGALERDFARLVAHTGRAQVARVARGHDVAAAVQASRAERVILYLPLSTLVDALAGLLASARVLPELVAVVPVARRSLRRLPPSMALLDWCLAPTRFGVRALQAAWPEPLEGEGQGATTTRFTVVSPGVDLLTYGPLSDPHDPHALGLRRARARRALLPRLRGSALGLWVLHASPADPGARLGVALKGFARFAQRAPASTRFVLNAPRAELHAHGPMLDALAPHLVFTLPDDPGAPLSDASLDLLYNACEVGVSTSGPCAWSQRVADHAATGAVQVLPDHTCFAEAWTGAARLLHVEAGRQVDPGAVADALGALIMDPAARQRSALACLAAARAMGAGFSEWDRLLGARFTPPSAP
jgi:hypothetical protein